MFWQDAKSQLDSVGFAVMPGLFSSKECATLRGYYAQSSLFRKRIVLNQLQMAVLLSRPEKDFTGGEFVLTEQRPRMQSRVAVVPLTQGDAVIFAVNHRPKLGKRGYYRVTMRHGVSAVRSGSRFTAGIIFHDSR